MTGLENPTHILFVLVVAVLVLGPRRLPEVGRSLGAGIREFRNTMAGEKQDKSGSSSSP
jgi:sec-independent protein translocase protein TatA